MNKEDKKLLKLIGIQATKMAAEMNQIFDNGAGKDFDFLDEIKDSLNFVVERIESFSMRAENRPLKPPPQEEIESNRAKFLNELRTGKHKKGTIKSDEKGYPVFETDADRDGRCACAIMGSMFGATDKSKISLSKAAKALGIDNKQCGYIQREINDTALTFPEMADRIEKEVFNYERKHNNNAQCAACGTTAGT